MLEKARGFMLRSARPVDLARWVTDYVGKPSQLLWTGGAFLDEYRELALEECELIIRTQEADGAWPVTWRWDAYPEAWAIAKNWWRGSIAVRNVCFMRLCGKM